jgi:hypothetical protein
MQKAISTVIRKYKNGISYLKIQVKQKIRILQNKEIIHVFGDSHSLLFQHELFKIHYIGPATAYNLGSEKSSNKSMEKISNELKTIPNNKPQKIVFVFGEIDARIHIYKIHKEKNIDIDSVIEKTSEQYIKCINKLRSMFPEFTFIVFNVLPPGEQGNYYNYRFYADRDTRLKITRKLNEKLLEITKKNDIKFVTLFDALIDSQGNRIKELIFDDIHYSNKIVKYVIKELCA